VWPYLGENLSMNIDKHILFINFGIGATCVDQWRIDKLYFERMNQTLKKFVNNTKLKIDYFIYHQGECDNNKNTSFYTYKKILTSIFRTLHKKYNSKVILNIASRTVFKKSKKITNAQESIINDLDFVDRGVDTDENLGHMDERFGVHFSEKGLKKFGRLLSDRLLKLEDLK